MATTMARIMWCTSIRILLFYVLFKGASATTSEDLRGKNFVFAFPPNLYPEKNTFKLVLTPCDGRTIVNVSTPSSDLEYFSTHLIAEGGSLTVTLPREIASEREDFFINGTVVLSADQNIYVVAISGQTRTMATFPIIPTTSLGVEYVIVSYVNEMDKDGMPSEFVISSLAENTHVTMQLTGSTLPSNDWIPAYPSGELVQLELQPYQSLLFRSAHGLTGTRIWSDKPISVVSGNACIFVPSDYLACDHIVEHLPPVNRWGTRYIIPPFLGRQSGYIYRVVAARDSTTISYTDKSTNTVMINAGEFIERDIDAGDISLISADKPIIVAQYSKGNFTDGIGDPAMILITPVEQYVNNVSFTNFDVSSYNIGKEYLTIVFCCDYIDDILFDGSSIRISDTSLMEFESTQEYCVVSKQLWTHDVHRLTSTREEAKFAAFQYGFGTRIAYGHPVAFGLNRLACNGFNRYGHVEANCKAFDGDTDDESNNPSIACPPNITMYSTQTNTRTISWDEPVAFTDTDDVIAVRSDHQSGSTLQVGMTPVTYTATSTSGDASTCVFYVIVKEASLQCPNDQRIIADIGLSSMIVTWDEPTLLAADSSVTVTSNHQSGEPFLLGITSVTYSARDQYNELIANCRFNIKVVDKESPVISCPDDQEIFAPIGNTDASVTWDAPIALDNSGHVSEMNTSHVPGGLFRIGTTAVVCTAWDRAGNTGVCAFYVTVFAQCPEEMTTDPIDLTWPLTIAGNTAESNQKCHINTERRGYGLAMRFCSSDESSGARWESPRTQDCGKVTTQIEMYDLQITPVAEDNVQEVVETLAEITTAKNMTVDEASAVAKTLENVVHVDSPSVEVTQSVIQVVDNYMESVISNTSSQTTPLSVDVDSSTSMLESLEHQISLSLHDGKEISTVLPNIAVEGLQLGQNSSQGDLSFAVLASDTEFEGRTRDLETGNVQVYKNTSHIPYDRIETSITLPKTLLNKYRKDLQISFIVFQDDTLFPSEKIQNGTSILAGSIISASIEDMRVVNLSEPVIIEITPTKIPLTSSTFNRNTTGCYFYDKISRDWSDDGCKAMWSDDVIQNGRIICHCNHLTNFAVIVDWRGNNVNSAPHLQFALDVISKIGCVLSVIALTVTIITFLSFRKLRTTRPRRILIHFCIALFFLYLIFLAGIDASESTIGCTIVAALLHYFTLVTVAWMAVEARNMYLTLVKVFDAETPHFMTRSCIAAWGAPFLVVVGTLSGAFHHYRNSNYCFLSPGPTLYFGLLLPIVLVLLHNFITFALVMRRLLRSNVGGTLKERGRFHNLSMRLKNALAISVLLGLTWVFGFLAIDDATFIFQLLFCLFNTFQGVFVFLLFCLRQEDVRKTLYPYFTWAQCPQWSAPRWKTVPNKSSTQTTSNCTGTTHARLSLPLSNDHAQDTSCAWSLLKGNDHAQDTSLDMASSTDMSISEVRLPVRLS